MHQTNMSATASNPSGYLEIIIGSMFSGKTSRLVEIYKQCQFCNIAVAVINHLINDMMMNYYQRTTKLKYLGLKQTLE